MRLKKYTDYVNAQFEDATENIIALFKEITKENLPPVNNEIAAFECNLHSGWFHDSYILYFISYKEEDTVHMICFTTAWKPNTTRDVTYDITISQDWGKPRTTYSESNDKGSSFKLEPTATGAKVTMRTENDDDNMHFIVTDSWGV